VVKPHVRALESEDGVLIVDDSIAEKPYTDENEIVCWHYDHAQDRQVKGINFMTVLYRQARVSLPVGFTLVAKTEHYTDKKDGKPKRRSPVGKNEYYRQMLQQAVHNQIRFTYVLNDAWFASAENMRWVKHTLHKELVMPIKTNRQVALSLSDREQGRFQRVELLELEPTVAREAYLEGLDFAVLLVQQVFVNEDGSSGVQYLVTSNLTLSGEQISALYRKRWNVELYHKSLKQNASLEKSPTQTVWTQTNHKLELLKVSTRLNHFALKSRLYLQALRIAFKTLHQLQPARLAA
jgi:hypothetical protein